VGFEVLKRLAPVAPLAPVVLCSPVAPVGPVGIVTPCNFKQFRYAARAGLLKPAPAPNPPKAPKDPFGRYFAHAASAFWNVGEANAPKPVAPDDPVGRWNAPLAPEAPKARLVGKVTPWLFRQAMNAVSLAALVVPDFFEDPDVPDLLDVFFEVFSIAVFVDFVVDDAAAVLPAAKRMPITPTASTAMSGRKRTVDGEWIITRRGSHIVLGASR
jgi:hypothetical protein